MDEILQRTICRQYGSPFLETPSNSVVGLSQNLRSGDLPIHGLRHLTKHSDSGWYIWAGDYSDADDFF